MKTGAIVLITVGALYFDIFKFSRAFLTHFLFSHDSIMMIFGAQSIPFRLEHRNCVTS